MDTRDTLARLLTALHEAALDDALWSATSALIDEACGMTGNALVVSEGSGEHSSVLFARSYRRGQRNEDLEQYYFCNYYRRDERIPRLRNLPDSLLVRVPDLYTEEEKKTSPAYNEGLPYIGSRNGLGVRLDGPNGTRIIWAISDPSRSGGWDADQFAMIERLLPHIRQFVRVRQAMVDAQALGTSFSALLDNTRTGIVQLDRRGRIVEINNRALDILRRRDGLFDQDGRLSAWLPGDNARLQRLLAAAIPPFGGQGVGRSMTIARSAHLPRLVLHIHPVGGGRWHIGVPRVAALVMVVEPESRPRLDARLVSEALGLTAAESEVAVMLSEGRTVREIAAMTDRKPGTVHDLIKRAYGKHGISRQAALVRLVLQLADLSAMDS